MDIMVIGQNLDKSPGELKSIWDFYGFRVLKILIRPRKRTCSCDWSIQLYNWTPASNKKHIRIAGKPWETRYFKRSWKIFCCYSVQRSGISRNVCVEVRPRQQTSRKRPRDARMIWKPSRTTWTKCCLGDTVQCQDSNNRRGYSPKNMKSVTAYLDAMSL